ncbi:NUDIX hydrolase [Haloferax volcanii]|uniref:NUDIX domain-containing protein n=2 Tax=Haloferax volcanii TaxID=2246 RepID=A0A6C0UN84_HALVO|nr:MULTISPECIES: NUDIX hydrolase [Haloferax]MBC9984858.1 NUDIX hydrolase [Haloferax sp. AS1]ELK54949.1 NTP pyrophosphohydrolase [Haloferax sp. BAB-2207]ELZ90830.1 NTP pyrophosphohydrolase [Haloferax alexandrinus JCM 10717]NLV01072.1 NUDIX domain-containing protein [Haloferax alexandrinus]QIB76707.1 NUDIX hydrolase [Haloferax alexandrinus]
MSHPPTLTFAAGGLLRRDDGRLCLVHRPRYDDWSLPKGKLEPGETLVETAVREVREETRCEVDCGRFAGRYEYRVPDDAETQSGPKGVFVWHMRVVDEHQFEPDAEVDARQWVTPVEALQRLTYETERALVRRAFELNE